MILIQMFIHDVFNMYLAGVFPTIDKLVIKMNGAFEGSSRCMLSILKGMSFRYVKCNNGRKFLMEDTDITAARITFL